MKKYLRDMNTQELETVLKNNEFLQHEITKMNEYDCELLARDGQEELAKKIVRFRFSSNVRNVRGKQHQCIQQLLCF